MKIAEKMRFEVLINKYTSAKNKTDCLCGRWFEEVALYCRKHGDLIPVAFILGFYVNIVVSRFWQQLNSLPWLHRTAFFVGSMIHKRDEQGRILRRAIMRHLTVAYILTMKDICPPVRKRFPSLQRIRDLGRRSRVDVSIKRKWKGRVFM